MAQPSVIVVNNDTEFLDLMHDLLKMEGYQATICKEGERAYPMIKEAQPDLVVLDIRLEHAESGWNILELLRLDPTTTHIPVIVCSADARFLRDKAATLHELRCDILEKPFDLDALLAKVANALRGGRADE